MKTASKFETDLSSLILRLGFGFFMVFGHGLGKLQMLFAGGDIMFASVFGLSPLITLILATSAEFLAALAVLVGFKTRLASLPVVITMAVAAFIIHFSDPLFAAQAQSGGSKEMALLFLFGFLGTMFLGSGRYSLDGLLMKNK